MILFVAIAILFLSRLKFACRGIFLVTLKDQNRRV